MTSRRPYPWKVFLLLWLAGVATSPLVIPYFEGLARIATAPPELPSTTLALILRLVISNAVVLAFGYLSWKRGQEAPITA